MQNHAPTIYPYPNLEHLPRVRQIIRALDDVANMVNYRRWRVFLRCMFVFSLFTLPVQLFDKFDAGVSGAVSFVYHHIVPSTYIPPGPLLKALLAVDTLYVYLADWWLTVLILFAVVDLLAPTEQRNQFGSIQEAVDYFYGKIFRFARYFWCSSPPEPDALEPTTTGEDGPSPWDEVARVLHEQTIALDNAFLTTTFQGLNSRVAAVFEEDGGPEGKPGVHCLHYQRIGRSAFVVAVDDRAERSSEGSLKSQKNFLHLAESIGCLINVRHSLKYSPPQFVRRITG
jgi:hypothetical protein